MAINGSKDKLTNRHLVDIAEVISPNDLESIALKYLNISTEKIKTLKAENKENPDALKRDVVRIWANRNSGPNQVKVSYYH